MHNNLREQCTKKIAEFQSFNEEFIAKGMQPFHFMTDPVNKK